MLEQLETAVNEAEALDAVLDESAGTGSGSEIRMHGRSGGTARHNGTVQEKRNK